MKLRNKQTGEIYDFKITPDYDDVMSGWKIENKDFGVRYYSHLAELNEEWEDYEEPKEHWFIDYDGGIIPFNRNKETATDNLMKQIGNYFETKEEAEKAVETLKAWKRLKDNGLVIKKWSHTPDMHLTTGSFLKIEGFIPAIMKNIEDLDLLFGGGE